MRERPVMRSLSKGLLAVLVSMLVSTGLIVSSAAPAQADWKDTVTKVSSVAQTLTTTPGEYMLSELTEYGMGAAGLTGFLTKFGTEAEVRAGTKLATKCKGWTCLILPTAAIIAGLGYLGYKEFGESEATGDQIMDPGTGVSTFGGGASHPCMQTTITGVNPAVIQSIALSTKSVYNPPASFGGGTTACQPENIVDAQCRSNTTGAVRNAIVGGTWYSTAAVGVTQTRTLAACSNGETVQWFAMRPGGSVSTTALKVPGHGYEMVFSWGTRSAVSTDRNWTRYTCKTPSGSTYTVDAVESAAGSGSQPLPACNPGDTVTLIETGLRHADGSSTVQSVLNTEAATAEGAATFPECVSNYCRLAVRTTDGKECTSSTAGCDDWASDPTQFRCFYGTYERPIAACAPMERAYESTSPSAIPATRPNTDGKPATWDSPEPVRKPTTAPSPNPTYTAPPNPFPSSTPNPSGTPSPSSSPTAPTPTTTSTTRSDQCESPYNLGPVDAGLVRAVNDIGKKFNFAENLVGGYRSGSEGDHTAGIAADFMTYTNKTLGQAAASYAQANARSLGIRYIIWQQHIWNIEKASQGWRLMPDRGSPTENHMDHVHVSTYPTDSPGQARCGSDNPENDPEDAAKTSRCFPSGWGVFNPFAWVYKPVMCALDDAFAPDKVETARRLDEVKGKLTRSGPGPAWAQMITVLDSVPQESGCSGPAMNFQLGGQPFSVKLFNACEEPMKTAAGYAHTLATVVVSITGILAIARAVAMGFGFNFSMGRGSTDEV